MKTVFTLVFVFSCVLFGPAWGGEVETGTAVVCNTQKQVEKFVASNDGDLQSAIRAINDEEKDPTACGVANLAFIRGHHTVTVQTESATFQIADILVIGVVTPTSVQSTAPSVQFSLFKIDERRA
jgi:hypothetical protein